MSDMEGKTMSQAGTVTPPRAASADGVDEAARESRDSGAKSLRKMSVVLDCFTRLHPTLTVGEISEATGLPRTTVHRIVASLREVGMLDQDGRRQSYRLGLKMFHYGSSVLASLDTPRRAHPHIAKLQLFTGEIIHFHMFDGSQMVCVEREEMGSSRLTTLTTIEGAPTYCTSVGKAFLAFQDETLVRRIAQEEGLRRYTPRTITDLGKLLEELALIRSRGFAIDDEENQVGLRCIGAPIRDAAGRVFASVSVSGPAERMPDIRLEGLAPLVIQTANDISKALA
ncbi:IclR family transcriptional regulator [Mesorhizobium sp. B2-1-3A]|uniref:IclR family transcriptional regulator n=1 Tax=Mesorhizobium sp. B2-1-3A TaxID=2589971 RepID=UPI001FEFFB65|nr:IclR family transcriptional regulator [Mesorhizobium sp. B2-1-3A]